MASFPGGLVHSLQTGADIPEVVTEVFRQFGRDVVAALPGLLSGLLFLLLAGTAVTLATAGLRVALRTLLPNRDPARRQFVVTTVSILLWFGVLLAAFSLLGLDAVVTSMGTTAAFLALGIGYAISHMIKDAVSGVYLLRDEDFTPGDRVTVDGLTATVSGIGLRKSRFRHDGKTTVLRNTEVEQKWSKLDDETVENGS